MSSATQSIGPDSLSAKVNGYTSNDLPVLRNLDTKSQEKAIRILQGHTARVFTECSKIGVRTAFHGPWDYENDIFRLLIKDIAVIEKNDLDSLYRFGLVCKASKESSLAIELVTQAANKGHVAAMRALGIWYSQEKAEGNADKAAKWKAKAVESQKQDTSVARDFIKEVLTGGIDIQQGRRVLEQYTLEAQAGLSSTSKKASLIDQLEAHALQAAHSSELTVLKDMDPQLQKSTLDAFQGYVEGRHSCCMSMKKDGFDRAFVVLCMLVKDIQIIQKGDTESLYRLGLVCKVVEENELATKLMKIAADKDHAAAKKALNIWQTTKGKPTASGPLEEMSRAMEMFYGPVEALTLEKKAGV